MIPSTNWKFSKKDFGSSLLAGLETGLIAALVINFLQAKLPGQLALPWLIIIVPLLWIAGVNLGYFLGRWFDFFAQFGKFAAIGFTNFAVDSGVLYLFIANTGIKSGAWYTVFKAISFSIAVSHSYFWNKYWVFDAGRSGGAGAEAVKFFVVMGLSALVNVAVASVIVNLIQPAGTLSAESWAGIGAATGSAAALIFSFIGFRLAVFKNK